MATRNFCLLLLAYVNYFCVALLSIVLKGLCEFGKGVQGKFSERVDFVCISIVFFVEDKKYVSKLPFLEKEQVEFILLSRNLYRKTVLL